MFCLVMMSHFSRHLCALTLLYSAAGAIKLNPLMPAANQKDVETSLAKWLTGARDREGLRSQRMQSARSRIAETDYRVC